MPFARIVVASDFASVRTVWLALQAVAPISPYQTFDFLSAWSDTEGKAAGITPMIVVAYDRRDQPIVLLPLGIERSRLLRCAVFLGGRQCNYNMGLFDPAAQWSAASLRALLRETAEVVRPRIDLFGLVNQPVQWEGCPNPLAQLPGQPSPSFNHRADLDPDPDAYLREHLSGRARKTARTKLNRLAALGPISTLTARTPDEVRTVLAAYVEQKASKLATLGIAASLDAPGHLDFLNRIALDGSKPGRLELFALFCGSRVVATFGGLAHVGRFSGLLISYDTSEEIARNSPGELLLAEVVRQKCLEGVDTFDLGIGEARYKETYCPIPDPLFDCFIPNTLGGRAVVALQTARLRLKRTIKQSNRTWRFAQRLRRLGARLRGGRAA